MVPHAPGCSCAVAAEGRLLGAGGRDSFVPGGAFAPLWRGHPWSNTWYLVRRGLGGNGLMHVCCIQHGDCTLKKWSFLARVR